MDNALHLIGLARRGGRLEAGEEPVGAAARAGHARLLVLAADAAGNTLRRADHFAQAGRAPLVQCPYTKTELGLAAGRGSCAMLAFTDAGLAAAFAGRLAARNEAAYGETARLLAHRARRVLARQREQRRHEKQLQRAKAHPWVPPRVAAGRSGKPKPNHGPGKGTKRGGGRQVT